MWKKKQEGREINFILNLSFGNLLTPGIILRNYFIKSSVAKILEVRRRLGKALYAVDAAKEGAILPSYRSDT
jgi:hypothetical protein